MNGLKSKQTGTNPEKLWSLNEMERTGGEPDVVGYDKNTGEYFFYDCSGPKALKAAEMLVTIMRAGGEGKARGASRR